jgi:hypothetical protein
LDVIIVFCENRRRRSGDTGLRWHSQGDNEQRFENERAGEHQHAAGVASRQVVQHADQSRAHEAAEVAD